MSTLRSTQDFEKASRKKERTERITKRVAIGFVFVGVFYFFIKLLFL